VGKVVQGNSLDMRTEAATFLARDRYWMNIVMLRVSRQGLDHCAHKRGWNFRQLNPLLSRMISVPGAVSEDAL